MRGSAPAGFSLIWDLVAPDNDQHYPTDRSIDGFLSAGINASDVHLRQPRPISCASAILCTSLPRAPRQTRSTEPRGRRRRHVTKRLHIGRASPVQAPCKPRASPVQARASHRVLRASLLDGHFGNIGIATRRRASFPPIWPFIKLKGCLHETVAKRWRRQVFGFSRSLPRRLLDFYQGAPYHYSPIAKHDPNSLQTDSFLIGSNLSYGMGRHGFKKPIS